MPTTPRGVGEDAFLIDVGDYRAAEPERSTLPTAAPVSWSELEGSAVRGDRDRTPLTQPVPIPAAVH
jgi:hypothetical protein